jgi:hypothetical protein
MKLTAETNKTKQKQLRKNKFLNNLPNSRIYNDKIIIKVECVIVLALSALQQSERQL